MSVRNGNILTCLSEFSDIWSPVFQSGFEQKEFIANVIGALSHFLRRDLLILDFKSVYGILNLSRAKSKADLESELALISSHFNVVWYLACNNLLRFLHGV